jgi:hypothetical protein
VVKKEILSDQPFSGCLREGSACTKAVETVDKSSTGVTETPSLPSPPPKRHGASPLVSSSVPWCFAILGFTFLRKPWDLSTGKRTPYPVSIGAQVELLKRSRMRRLGSALHGLMNHACKVVDARGVNHQGYIIVL